METEVGGKKAQFFCHNSIGYTIYYIDICSIKNKDAVCQKNKIKQQLCILEAKPNQIFHDDRPDRPLLITKAWSIFFEKN